MALGRSKAQGGESGRPGVIEIVRDVAAREEPFANGYGARNECVK